MVSRSGVIRERTATLVDWVVERRHAIVVIALLVIVRLWLADALDVRTLRSPADDELYVSHAIDIRGGRWLGAYDDFTLVKTPGYPIYLAIVSLLPVPLLVVEHALYLLAGAMFVAGLWPIANRRWLGAAYAVYAVNPLLFAEDQTRLTRDLLYSTFTVALAAALIAMYVRRRAPTRVVAGWALLAGASLAVLALTREDTLWVMPFVAVGLAPTAWTRVRAAGGRVGPLLSSYLLVALPFLVTLVAVLGVSAANQSKYGEFAVVDLEDGDYRDALGALLRVKGESEIDFVPLPADARAALTREVPRYATIAAAVDQWVGTGCESFAPACDDLTAAHFEWAIRYGVRVAGHYDSAAEASAFYRLLADDVDRACDSGALACRDHAGSLIGDLDGDDVGAIIGSFGDSLRWVIRPDPIPPNDRPTNLPRSPDVEQVTNRDWVEVGRDASEVRLFGWVHEPAGGTLDLEVIRADGTVDVLPVDRLASPDVAAVLVDPTAGDARFDETFRCGDACVALFRVGGVGALRVEIDGRSAPVVEPGATALGVVDIFSRGPDQRFLQSARLRVFDLLFWLSDFVLLPLLGGWLVLASSVARRRGASSVGVLACLVLLVGIGSRLTTVAVVDALLFNAVRAQYLLPAGFLAYALPFALTVVPRWRTEPVD